MKRRIFFLNIDKLSELGMSGSSFIPFQNSRRKERAFEKTMFYIENGNAVYIPWTMRWVPHRN